MISLGVALSGMDTPYLFPLIKSTFLHHAKNLPFFVHFSIVSAEKGHQLLKIDLLRCFSGREIPTYLTQHGIIVHVVNLSALEFGLLEWS